MAYDVDYVWQDGLLTHQNMTYYMRITIKNETRVVKIPFSAKFVYDESNTPVGCLVNDEAAVGFVRNLQGDVIAVVTHEGDVLAEYSYDPWGKVTISSDGETLEGLNAAIMAVCCPFTYRGYNYDYTTGLYYLQSRYYNPEWGRFLNVDDTNILLSTQGENLGANLFAYCNNNPVNYTDYTGYECEELIAVVVPIIAGLAIFAVLDNASYLLNISNSSDIMMDCSSDSYGLFFVKIATYNSDGKYHIKKALYGDMNSWRKYFSSEGQMAVTFTNSMAEAVTDQTRTLMQPGSGQWSAGGVGLVLLFDLAVYGIGRGIIEGAYKGDYVEEYLSNEGYKNAKGLIVYTKEETVSLRSTAWLKVQSNSKPRGGDIDEVRPIW